MKIDEILMRLNYEIEKETQISNAVHTVMMTHEAFNRTIIELYRSKEFVERAKYAFTPSSMNDCQIYGIRVLARERPKE